MGSNASIAGISRNGSAGNYTYSVIGSGDRPITYVSWFDAARFCNWLQNGQGAGSTETGAYNLNGASSGIFTVQEGITVRLPSESEWYKAASYDATMNAGGGGYWVYATQSNTMTSNDMTVAGAANLYWGNINTAKSAQVQNGLPSALSDVGAYGADSESYYGTNDQSGNVWELIDTINSNSYRGIRGGAWLYTDPGPIGTDSSGLAVPTDESLDLGFRVVYGIPEPTTLLLTMLASGAMLIRRRR
ncbi:SUMF1/EgtB/PvdO family nonheme iron enzyme [Luteolibacter sp.]|uniref:SUMF1/EgtB/PvdO family nonheme iron enzyme n=1 Tax=Luteolibacter sp. TaxID=1962973 RepID=UPI003265B90B